MAKRDSEKFDGYHKWLGISQKKRPPNHYDLLGVALDEDDDEVIQAAAQQRKEFVKSKRGEGHDDAVNEIVLLLTEAELTLKDPALRREYDRKMQLFDKRRRDRRFVTQGEDVSFSVRYKSKPGGGRVVYHSGDSILSEYGGIVGFICLAFFGIAALAFWMPWEKLNASSGSAPTDAQPAAPQPVAVVNAPANPAPVPAIEAVPQPAVEPAVAAEEIPAVVDVPAPVLSVTFDEVQRSYDIKNARLVNGVVGLALQCDGTTAIVVPSPLPAAAAPRTIVAWLKNEGQSLPRNQHVISYGGLSDSERPWGITHNTGVWACYGWNNEASTTANVDSGWHHHVLAYDGKKTTYYFDGALVAEAPGTLATTAGPLTLGTYYSHLTPENSFVGVIDDVAIYDVGLTTPQVYRLIELHNQRVAEAEGAQ